MNNWNFFQSLFSQLNGIIQSNAVVALNGALDYARPAVQIGVVAWIAARAIAVANGFHIGNEIWKDMLRAVVVLFLISGAGTYNQYIGNLATAIPNEVGTAIAGGPGGPGTASIANGAAFDTVWSNAAKAGMTVFGHVPKYTLASIPLWCAVVVYMAVALVAIGLSFLIYLASTMVLTLLLMVGPLFVALYAFPVTARFANGWVSALVSAIVTQILTVGVLMMFMATEAATVNNVTAGSALQEVTDELVTLGEAGLLTWLIYKLVMEMPGLSATIAGGFYHHVGPILSDAVGAGALAAKVMAKSLSGFNGKEQSGGATVPFPRPTQSTGRSISGGRSWL